ncbi:MAG: sprT domain-containing protein [Actinobacteria bacterium]|nr:MAG: sprT domain-containing protein [Actinomycetota bacterium]
MERKAARDLAIQLMAEHGLDTWSFTFDRARRRAGACLHSRCNISLSAPLVRLYEDEVVRGIILHEIAHALVGAEHHHDAVWKAQARKLGAPISVHLPQSLPQLDAPWVGVCPSCGMRRQLYSAPRRVTSCGKCSPVFDSRFIFEWSHRGVRATPQGRYLRELRRFH